MLLQKVNSLALIILKLLFNLEIFLMFILFFGEFFKINYCQKYLIIID